MTRSQMVLWSLLAVLLAFAPAGSAWAAGTSQVTDPNAVFQVNPNAPGTKIFGKLSIFYTLIDFSCPNNRPKVNMNIAIAAWVGSVKNSRTAGERTGAVCYDDTSAQRTAVVSLVTSQLLGKFSFSSFEIKDVSDLAQDEAGDGSDNNPLFLMLDFILAAR